MSIFDIIVVGAGPAGTTAARICAEEGFKVALLEKHKRLGKKVCAGGIDYRILEEFDVDDDVIQCITEEYCYSTYDFSKSVTLKNKSATVNRGEFDQYLAERAVDAGASLFLGRKAYGVIKKKNTIVGLNAKSVSGTSKIFGKIIIAADGFNSDTARSAGLLPKYKRTDIGMTVQQEVFVESKINENTKHIVYGKDISPCGFGWIYPKQDKYTVGVGSVLSFLKKNQLKNNLNYFIKKHPVASEILTDVVKCSEIQGACVPLNPRLNISGNGIMIIGDAAGQVSPLGGNGVYYAMKAGSIAGSVSIEAIMDEDVSIRNLGVYEKEFYQQFGEELTRQKRILELVKNHFDLYMKFRLYFDRHHTIRNILSKGTGFFL